MNFRIIVTANDIKKGKNRDIRNCPLARAIRHHRPLSRADAHVGLSYIMWERSFPNSTRTQYISQPLPQEAIDFRVAFDLGKPVEPFEFTLTLPDDAFEVPQADGTQE